MDFLFDNPLASMYGPYFLVLYIIFNLILLITFSVLKRQLDKTANFAMPPVPTNPDAFEIAYLRGGENELARSVIFSLTQKDLLKIVNEEKTSRFYQNNSGFDKRGLKPIEQAALSWFGTTREVTEIFHSNGLAQALKPFYETYQARLEQLHFVYDDETLSNLSRLRLIIGLTMAGLGIFKILAALFYGYTNIFGIIIVGIISLVILGTSGKLPRLTKLGKMYLERLQLAFDQLKNTHQILNSNHSINVQPTFASIDPLLLSVGVFGGAVLAGTMYDNYNQAFQRAQQSAGTSSSCGSACGSSSCSSSGGDSGGGCGGCGGGGD